MWQGEIHYWIGYFEWSANEVASSMNTGHQGSNKWCTQDFYDVPGVLMAYLVI